MNTDFLAMLDYLERERGIDRATLVAAIADAMTVASKKKFTSATRDLRIDINQKTGEIRAFATLFAKEHVTNPRDEIALTKARAIKPDIAEGEEIELEVKTNELGRIAAQAVRQAMNQRFRQIEKEKIYDEFKNREGEIITGTVRRFEKSDVIFDLGHFEGIMPAKERVVTEEYSIGDQVRSYVVKVSNDTRGPEIILSRSHPSFIRRLFELEISEIGDHTVEIKNIAREAGFRTKIAVYSADPKVDPVGACVGQRGSRVKNIVRELNNEKVDIIRWEEDPSKYVAGALKPAKIKTVTVDEAAHKITVTVDKGDLSLAIGKRGQNVRLTAKLTGWDIDIKEDRSAEKKRDAHVAQSAHDLTQQLGISEDDAQKLAAVGMTSVELVATADAETIATILVCPTDQAEQIFQKAKEATTPPPTA